MRILAYTLAGFIVLLLQYPLWFGKGGWLRVWEPGAAGAGAETDQRRARPAQRRARRRGARPEAGLRGDRGRARYELGLIKQDEIFFQVVHRQASSRDR